jgi:hypothetical protein
MVSRKAERGRVFTQVVQAQGARLLDQQPEDPAASWERSDLSGGRFVYSGGEELREQLPIVDNSKSSVAGVDESGSGFDDAVQHRLKVKVGADCEYRIEQAMDTIAGTHHRLELSLELAQKLVEMQMSAQWRAGCPFSRTVGHAPILLHRGENSAPAHRLLCRLEKE